jgi:beta-alanine degradation protein BauB
MGVSEDLGTSLILETDRVRIWEHRVPAGGNGPTHLHRRPYFSVVVRGTSGDTLGPDGAVVEHFRLEPGSVISYGEESLPETHALRNTGDDEILLVTTELL